MLSSLPFDIASRQPDSNGVWTVVLDSGAVFGGEYIGPVEQPSAPQAAWIGSARERVIDYLRSRPYHVIDSETTPKA